MDVSLVLNLHREGGLVLRTLMSLAEAAAYARVHGIKTEIVVVLDRADDATRRLIAAHDFLSFAQWRVIETDHGSLGLARNSGCEVASGKYISLCDGDDLVSFNIIYEMFAFSERAPEKVVLFPEWLIAFGSEYHFACYSDLACVTPLSFINMHPYVSRLFSRRELFEKRKFTDARLSKGYAFEDWHFNCDLVADGYDLRVVPDTFLFYRKTGNSLLDQATRISANTIAPTALFRPDVFLKRASEAVENPTPMDANGPVIDADYLDDPYILPMLRAANRIEPQFDLRKISESYGYMTYRSCRPDVGLAYYHICKQLVGKTFSHVFLLPYVTVGGADRYINNIITYIATSRPTENILVILGESSHRISHIYNISSFATTVDLSSTYRDLGDENANLIVLKILQSCCTGAVLHLRTSPFAFNFFKTFSSILKDHRVILYIFGIDVSIYKNAFLTEPFSLSFISENEKSIDAIVGDSQNCAEYCYTRYDVREKWRVIPTLCEPSISRAAAISRSSSSKTRVLWASRISKEKRPQVLKTIASYLSDIDASIIIDVYGSAEEPFHADEFSGFPNISQHGTYENFKDIVREDHACLLYTSYFDGVPTVLMEAAAFGLPIIAPDVGGVGEFVINETTGLLLPSLPSDEAMASIYIEAMLRILHDENLRIELAANAYDRVLDRNSFSAFTHRVDAVLKDLSDR